MKALFSTITAQTEPYLQDACACDLHAFAERHGPAFLLIEDFATGTLLPAKTNPFVVADFSEPTLSRNSIEKMAAGTAELRPSDVERQLCPRGMVVYPLVRRPSSTVSFVSVGRTPNNDVVLQHASISRFHAYFRRTNSGFVIQDAGSANGTTVNGVIVPAQGEGSPVEVEDGSELLLGAVYGVFLTAESFVAFVRGQSEPRAAAESGGGA